MAGAMAARDLVDALGSAVGREALLDLDPPLVVVSLDVDDVDSAVGNQLRGLPLVVVGTGATARADSPAAALVDVLAEGDALERIKAAATRTPIATTALAVLLRDAAGRSVNDGLAA